MLSRTISDKLSLGSKLEVFDNSSSKIAKLSSDVKQLEVSTKTLDLKKIAQAEESLSSATQTAIQQKINKTTGVARNNSDILKSSDVKQLEVSTEQITAPKPAITHLERSLPPDLHLESKVGENIKPKLKDGYGLSVEMRDTTRKIAESIIEMADPTLTGPEKLAKVSKLEQKIAKYYDPETGFVGKAQGTDKLGTHEAAIKILAEVNKDSQKIILLDQGLRKGTGIDIKPNKRPDLIILDKDGNIKLIEVQSQSQTKQQLETKCEDMIKSLVKKGIDEKRLKYEVWTPEDVFKKYPILTDQVSKK